MRRGTQQQDGDNLMQRRQIDRHHKQQCGDAESILHQHRGPQGKHGIPRPLRQHEIGGASPR